MFLNLLCPSLEYLSHVAVTVAHAEEEAILRNTPPPSQLLWISGITELYVLGKMGSLGPLYHVCIYIYIYIYDRKSW